ncbi:uncharacterized protein LY79DRAFT_547443 [Colletotrichum navitas]|uniref:Uncharacterized protein n=1 Tax=Colletotrichum navitas TaxID=681940 RepID=A0AAD8Q3M8_9PEZI|nr:uncharacterized protein LY79DRAFT_547443 [Colletotrichum navitas]KAK1595342.1 hypothetical protein LY79DRAFT_547443 [Colletotrichum navitas]
MTVPGTGEPLETAHCSTPTMDSTNFHSMTLHPGKQYHSSGPTAARATPVTEAPTGIAHPGCLKSPNPLPRPRTYHNNLSEPVKSRRCWRHCRHPAGTAGGRQMTMRLRNFRQPGGTGAA